MPMDKDHRYLCYECKREWDGEEPGWERLLTAAEAIDHLTGTEPATLTGRLVATELREKLEALGDWDRESGLLAVPALALCPPHQDELDHPGQD
jgi:hypothetical protein